MLLVVLQEVKAKTHFGVLLLSALLHCLRINHDMLWCKYLSSYQSTFSGLLESLWTGWFSSFFPRHNIFSYLSGCGLSTGHCSLQCFRCWHVWLCLSYSYCSLWHGSCAWGDTLLSTEAMWTLWTFGFLIVFWSPRLFCGLLLDTWMVYIWRLLKPFVWFTPFWSICGREPHICYEPWLSLICILIYGCKSSSVN